MATKISTTLPRDRQIITSQTDPIAAVFHAIRRWMRHRQQVRRTADLLSSLDDHLLADIGLLRDQVEQAATSGYLPVRHDGGAGLNCEQG